MYTVYMLFFVQVPMEKDPKYYHGWNRSFPNGKFIVGFPTWIRFGRRPFHFEMTI